VRLFFTQHLLEIRYDTVVSGVELGNHPIYPSSKESIPLLFLLNWHWLVQFGFGNLLLGDGIIPALWKMRSGEHRCIAIFQF